MVPQARPNVYIVLIGWLYVIGMIALASEGVGRGLVVFLLGGLAPALLVLWIAARRSRARAGRTRGDGDAG